MLHRVSSHELTEWVEFLRLEHDEQEKETEKERRRAVTS
jgi:hypothetical protein